MYAYAVNTIHTYMHVSTLYTVKLLYYNINILANTSVTLNFVAALLTNIKLDKPFKNWLS